MKGFDFHTTVAPDIQESRDRWETFLNDVEMNVYDWSGASLNNIVPSSVQFEKITFTESTGAPAVEINFNTGEINLADHMLLDDAARLFWDRVMQLNPYPQQRGQVEPLPSGHPYADMLHEDFIFPHADRGRGSKVESLPAGTEEVTAMEQQDIEYFQHKLTRALGVEDEVNYNRAMKVVK